MHACHKNRVYEGYPYLLAEMYAYSMGAAHQKLPHVQLWNYMVSNVDSHDEGWKWIDALDEVCAAPINGVFYPEHPMPTVVHYCQSYRAGEIGFMKRTAPRNMFSCESPMFKEPELGAGNLNYRVRQGKVSSHFYTQQFGCVFVLFVLDEIQRVLIQVIQ